MNQLAAAERLICCLLAQLQLDQNGELSLYHAEHYRRFGAVMQALRLYHDKNRAAGLPEVACIEGDPGSAACYYSELELVMLYWHARGWLEVRSEVALLSLTEAEAEELLRCLDGEEREVIRWLAGVYTNPSLAYHAVP